MAKRQPRQGIPTNLSVAQFEQFVLPHLSKGSRGPATKLGWHAIFNYILRLLYLGCPWKELPIEKDRQVRPEIHYTRIYRAFRRWQADGVLMPFSKARWSGLDKTIVWTSPSSTVMACLRGACRR
jgi:hypothetical protein